MTTSSDLRVTRTFGSTILPLCFGAEDTLDHLLDYCPFTRAVVSCIAAVFCITLLLILVFWACACRLSKCSWGNRFIIFGILLFLLRFGLSGGLKNLKLYVDVVPNETRCRASVLALVREADAFSLGHMYDDPSWVFFRTLVL